MVKKLVLKSDISEKTLADRALRLLREDIMTTRLAPDMRLRVVELQKRYQLGISPIREALLRLISEGFVVAEGQRGFAVASVSMEELQDLTRARIRLETIMLTEAIQLGDAQWEANIVAAFHLLSRTPPPVSSQDLQATLNWETCHRAFHDALLSGCGSAWMQRLQNQMAEHAERYRRIRMFHSIPNKALIRTIHNEHETLMQAMLARDTDSAVALVQSHLNNTASAVTGFYKPAASSLMP